MEFLKSFLLPYPSNVNPRKGEIATDYYYVPPPPPEEDLYKTSTRSLRSRTLSKITKVDVDESMKENVYIPKPYQEKPVWTAPKEDVPNMVLTALAISNEEPTATTALGKREREEGFDRKLSQQEEALLVNRLRKILLKNDAVEDDDDSDESDEAEVSENEEYDFDDEKEDYPEENDAVEDLEDEEDIPKEQETVAEKEEPVPKPGPFGFNVAEAAKAFAQNPNPFTFNITSNNFNNFGNAPVVSLNPPPNFGGAPNDSNEPMNNFASTQEIVEDEDESGVTDYDEDDEFHPKQDEFFDCLLYTSPSPRD
eukprot:TRINITY_DN3127_c0_g2_i1.p1 TRINITY_DN3127_c0_g2~~TRINITY_DN3127_c0_g2_i1.p1  ORF type:complete len:310 (-),score=104.87 TRINITY_DN3127_c0_g2_i1:11-940(-)